MRAFPGRLVRVGFSHEVPPFEGVQTQLLPIDAGMVVDALDARLAARGAAPPPHGVACGDEARALRGGRDRSGAEHAWLDAIASALRPGDVVACDMTRLSFWAIGGLALPDGARFLFPGLLAMGFGLPAALGAGRAAPDAHVVAVVGDGGLLAALPELDLAARWPARVTIVLADSDGYHMLRPSMSDRVGPIVCEFTGPRWDQLAAACGAGYERAPDPSTLSEILASRHTGVRVAHLDASGIGLGWRRSTLPVAVPARGPTPLRR